MNPSSKLEELSGKVALVTGASRGIGAAIAIELASRGANVAITYERSADRAAEVVRSIEALGRKAVAIQANSADPAAVVFSVEETIRSLGGVDILVNNAGIAKSGSFAEIGLSDINALLDINVRAVAVASQAVIPHLKPGGRIINIGSCLGERVPFGGVTMYSATKSALLALTRGLARELGPQQITVNLIQPGPIDTDMNPADGEFSEANRNLTALGRYGKPEELAAAVAFIAGPGASFVTGSMLTVDGGANA